MRNNPPGISHKQRIHHKGGILSEIRIKCYGGLNQIPKDRHDRAFLKHGTLVRIAEPTSIRDILNQLKIPISDVRLIFIGKERVRLDTAPKDGDTVHVFPIMGGG